MLTCPDKAAWAPHTLLLLQRSQALGSMQTWWWVLSKSRGELSDLMVKWQCGASAKKKPMGRTGTSLTPPSDSGGGKGAVASKKSLKMKTQGNKDFTEDRQAELGQLESRG